MKSIPSKIISVTSAILFLAVATLNAQKILVLPNGDRLSGDIVKTEAGLLYFATPDIGTISINAYKAELYDDENAPPPATGGLVLWKNKPDYVNGEFNVGFSKRSAEKDNTDLDLVLTIEVDNPKHPKDSYKWENFYNYGESEYEKSTDEYGTSFRYRRELTKSSFFQSLSSYEVDEIRDIGYDIQQAFSWGYKLIEEEKMMLNVGPSAIIQYIDQPSDFDGFGYFGGLFEEFRWLIHDDLVFYQSFDISLSLKDSKNCNSQFYIALETNLLGNLSLRLSYLLDYNNGVQDDIDESDSLITTSVVYKF
jgi:putative salt-induced outer membrane protein YdiY